MDISSVCSVLWTTSDVLCTMSVVVTHATVLHTGAMHGTTLHTTQVLCMCVVLDTGTMYTVLPPYIVLMLLSCVLCYLACMLVPCT